MIVPGGVDRTGRERVIPALLWVIERLAAQAELHVFALHQEPKPGQWPLLGATVHNIGRRPVTPRTLLTMMSEHRKAPFDVVHAYSASGPGVIAAAFRTLTGTPAALTLPGGDLCAFDDIEYGGLRTFAGRLRVRVAIAGENVVIAQSGPIRREAAELGIASQVLPFGVALNHWPVRQPAARVPGSALRLVHVADLNRIKDPETLLLALAHLHERGVEFHLDQLGLDTLGGSVRRRADDLGLGDRIGFPRPLFAGEGSRADRAGRLDAGQFPARRRSGCRARSCCGRAFPPWARAWARSPTGPRRQRWLSRSATPRGWRTQSNISR